MLELKTFHVGYAVECADAFKKLFVVSFDLGLKDHDVSVLAFFIRRFGLGSYVVDIKPHLADLAHEVAEIQSLVKLYIDFQNP